MMERFEMWRNARQNRSEFLRRVRFITIDGAKIGRPDEWLDMRNIGSASASPEAKNR